MIGPVDVSMENMTSPWNVTLRDVDLAYVALTTSVAAMSMFASLTVPVCLLMYPDVRTTGRRLLACLACANFILALGYIQQAATYYLSVWRRTEAGVACRMAGAVWMYGDVASALWADAVGLYLLLALAFHQVLLADRLVPLLHLFAWIMPGVVVVSALVSDVYGFEAEVVASGRHATWCWISDRVANRWQWQLLTSEGWALASYAFLAVTYVIISAVACCRRSPAAEPEGVITELAATTADRQLRYVPVLYVCLRLWPSIFTLTYHGSLGAPRTPSNDFFLLMKGLCGPAQGLAVALLFCLTTSKVRRALANKLRLCRRGPDHSIIRRWTPSRIVRRSSLRKKRNSDLDLSGMSFDLPAPGDRKAWEDEVLFERGYRVETTET